MSRALVVDLEAGPRLRTRKVATMAAESGWTVDLLSSAPAEWPWGQAGVITPDMRRRLARKVATTARPALVGGFDPAIPTVRARLAAQPYDVVYWPDLSGGEELAGLAASAGCRFVVDFHENYPYNLWSTERDLGLRSARYNLNAWFRVERAVADAAAAVIVTIDEMGQRLTGMHGTDPLKIFVVHNTEDADVWHETPPAADLVERFAGRVVLLYGGSCSAHRGVDTAIRAMHLLRDELPQLTLVIAGDGPAISGWRRLVTDLDVGTRVHFEGHVPLARLKAYYAVTAAGLVPHHKYGQTDNTVPHKLYQNMVMGIPTVVSSCHALQRLAVDTGGALVFSAGVPSSAADAFRSVMDPELRTRLGRAGWDAVRRPPLSWGASRRSLMRAFGATP
jgi:glycosyltransferase involved in cell wall biosynthesis